MANILLLISSEDRVTERRIHMSLLSHVIEVVYDVRSAFCQLYLFKPDLVLAEWFQAEGLALGALFLKRYLEEEAPKPPLALLAGVPQPEQLGHFRHHAKKMGASGFIALPRNEDDREFAVAVERMLAKQAPRRTWLTRGMPRLPERGPAVGVPVYLRPRDVAAGQPSSADTNLPERRVEEVMQPEHDTDTLIDGLLADANRRYRNGGQTS